MSKEPQPRMWDAKPTWTSQAACRGKGKIFHPHNVVERDKAIRICHTCPVIRECDAYATRNKEKEGVWGGKLRGRIIGDERPKPEKRKRYMKWGNDGIR